MKALVFSLLLAWYLVLRTEAGGIALGPYDSKDECYDIGDVILPMLSHLGLQLTYVACIDRQDA